MPSQHRAWQVEDSLIAQYERRGSVPQRLGSYASAKVESLNLKLQDFRQRLLAATASVISVQQEGGQQEGGSKPSTSSSIWAPDGRGPAAVVGASPSTVLAAVAAAVGAAGSASTSSAAGSGSLPPFLAFLVAEPPASSSLGAGEGSLEALDAYARSRSTHMAELLCA